MKKKIDDLVNNILASRKNANKITDLIEFIQDAKNVSLKLSAIEGSIKVFQQLSENNEILFEIDNIGEKSKVELYKLWVGERFSDCCNHVLDCLFDIAENKQNSVLTFFMKLLKIKSSFFMLQQASVNEIRLCQEEILNLVTRLVNNENSSQLECFFNFLQYDLIRYIVLNIIPLLLKQYSKESDCTEKFLEMLFSLLKEISKHIPQGVANQNKVFLLSEKALSKSLEIEKKVNPLASSQQRKVFTKAWLMFLKQPFSTLLHKEILIILHSSLIVNFSNPRLLSDFLIKSFNQGGGLALLGLHGLFILVHEHNLEYPDFYKNLYTLLHPRIFQKKYKNRFFHLLQLFLSSTHIPSYIVSAFVKKMSRLTLTAPPHGILVLLALITILIKLHPSILGIIDSKNGESIAEDPYIETEEDLKLCNASQSSLWELDTLLNHYLPEVVQAAAAVKKVNVVQPDLNELMETGYKELIDFDEDMFTSSAMNDAAPTGIIGNSEDIVGELWSI